MLVCDNFEENELQPIEEILKVPTKKERRDSSEQIHREPVRSSHRLNSNEEYRTPSATEMESCFVSLERLSIVFVDTDDSDSDSKEVVEIIKPAKARKRMREHEDKEGSRRSKSRKGKINFKSILQVSSSESFVVLVEPETPEELIEPKTEPQDASCIEITTEPPQSPTARRTISKNQCEFFSFLKTS